MEMLCAKLQNNYLKKVLDDCRSDTFYFCHGKTIATFDPAPMRFVLSEKIKGILAPIFSLLL